VTGKALDVNRAVQNATGSDVNKICIAAYSRRTKTEAFSFEGVMMNRTNLREGVIWVRPDDEESKETTQEIPQGTLSCASAIHLVADDYIRMGCADLKYMNMESGSGQQMRNDHILVVGGGVGGMTAAIEAAQADYKATIVEKSGELSGWVCMNMIKTGRMDPMEILGDHSIKDTGGLQKIIKKTQELEAARCSTLTKEQSGE
jgi:quinone-modifying oxidoreductase, subunit QmoB